jgi:hypothetical protein
MLARKVRAASIEFSKPVQELSHGTLDVKWEGFAAKVRHQTGRSGSLRSNALARDVGTKRTPDFGYAPIIRARLKLSAADELIHCPV